MPDSKLIQAAILLLEVQRDYHSESLSFTQASDLHITLDRLYCLRDGEPEVEKLSDRSNHLLKQCDELIAS